MGSRRVPPYFRGIIRPDPGLEFYAADSGVYDIAGTRVSDIGEASPVAGLADPSQSTDMALRVSGTQTENIEVYCQRRGLPILDEAAYLWKIQGESDSLRRGCDLSVPCAVWQPIDLINARLYYHLVKTPTDHLITCYQDAGGNTYSRTLDPEAGVPAWGGEVTVDAAGVTLGYPCLLVVPRVDGYRVMLYRWADDGTDHQVRAWHSDDNGATWTDDGVVLLAPLDGTAYPNRRRLRAAYLDGQVLLVGHVQAVDSTLDREMDRLVQWASSDGGGQFSLVTISDGTDVANAGAWHDLCVWRGEFILGRLIYHAGSTSVVPAFRRLASAWYPWTSGSDDSSPSGVSSGQHWGVYTDPGAGADQYIGEGELALWADDVGALYAAGRHCAGGDDGAHPILRSVDGADSWTVMGDHPTYPGPGNNGSAWWNTGGIGPVVADPDNELRGFCGVHQRGRGVLVTSWQRAASGTLGFMAAVYLGGWQSTPMAPLSQALSPATRTAWDYTGCGMHLPSETIWTLVLGFGGTETLTNGRVVQVTGALAPTYNEFVPTTTVAQGILGEWGLSPTPGTARIEMRTSDATPIHYEVAVEITAATVTLVDLITNAPIGAPYAHTHLRLRIRLALRGSSVVCLVRGDTGIVALGSQDEFTEPDRLWTEVARTAALNSAAANPGMRVRFGIDINSSASWDEWHVSAGKYTGEGIYTQPDRLKFGRSLIESPSWAGHGVKLASVSGPAATGDTWRIDASSDYPYNAVLPTVSPCPRHTWRGPTLATTVGAAGNVVRLTYRRSSLAESAMSPVWGVYLDRLGVGGVEVWLEYGGAFHLAGSVGYWGFVASRAGRTLTVTSGAPTNSAVLRRNELEGCLVEFVSGTPKVSDFQYRCIANAPGHIDTSAGLSVPLRMVLDREDGGAPASPTVRVYPRRALLIIDMALHNMAFRALQIRFPQSLAPAMSTPASPGWPPEGYPEIGIVAAGPFWPFSPQHSSGFRLSTEVDTELITAQDGTRIAYQRSPARRRWSLSWSDGVHMRNLRPSNHAPDFDAFSATALGLAFRNAVPVDLADQLRALSGSLTPVVYCPSIEAGSTGRPDHWADGAMLCRITSAVERDNRMGPEERGEVARVQELILEEEV